MRGKLKSRQLHDIMEEAEKLAEAGVKEPILNWELAIQPRPQGRHRLAHLIIGQKAITGSSSGGREDTRDMLRFSARHNIKPIIEVMKMSQCNEAVERVKKGQARFRVVMENDIS